ncbi:phosphatases II [Peniophora sp. CONT]|nr:phosphatases II [Peniophora sp. CONT]
MAVVTQNMPSLPHAGPGSYRLAPTLTALRIPSRPAALSLATCPTKGGSRAPYVNGNAGSTPMSPTGTLSEIVPRVYVSDLSVAEDASLLAAAGITHVLSVLPLARSPPSMHARTHMVVPLQDTPFAELAGYLPSTTSFIDKALRSSPHARVLVHCAMGASRSVSVVAAYLIASRGMSSAEAVAAVKARRAVAAPNWGFVMQLEEYARQLEADAEADSPIDVPMSAV